MKLIKNEKGESRLLAKDGTLLELTGAVFIEDASNTVREIRLYPEETIEIKEFERFDEERRVII